MIQKKNQTEVKSLLETALPDVSRETIDQLFRYIFLAVEWNHHLNLTGASSPQEFTLHHVFDCVAASIIMEKISLCCDVGTGAGLPGIVWALLFPTKKFLLVESTQKKAAFLHRAISHLGLRNIRILSCRYETLSAEDFPEQKLDRLYCVSRGTAAPEALLKMIRTHFLPWESWFVFSTEKTHEEFLTLGPKFGMEIDKVQYPEIPSRSAKAGLLTVLKKLN